MVQKLTKYERGYNKVVITDRYDQPYILTLFYKNYPPQDFQPQAKLTERDKFNFGTIRSFDKYEFRKIDPNEINKNTKTLYIGTKDEVGNNNKIIDEVDFPDGKPGFLFAEGSIK